MPDRAHPIRSQSHPECHPELDSGSLTTQVSGGIAGAPATKLRVHSRVHDGDGTIRYGQCWEDADVLLAGLDVRPGEACLVIASAGDNALALLTRRPGRVVAVDVSAAQLHALALRVAAYRTLDHGALLELLGARPSRRRRALYARCRVALDADARRFWDAQPAHLDRGLIETGRFERYFRLFRRAVLPLAHPPRRVRRLLESRRPAERARFYDAVWCNRRWRLLARLFFSRAAMARLGRDRRFFAHAEGPVADRVLARARHACVALNPAANPYLTYLLTGRYGDALPLALRPEHFDAIRDGLDRLTWQRTSLEGFLARQPAASFDRFGLSDVLEYMTEPDADRVLADVARVGRAGGRVAYWNLLVPRSRPAHLADRLRPLPLGDALHAQDRAFFYSRFVVEALAGAPLRATGASHAARPSLTLPAGS